MLGRHRAFERDAVGFGDCVADAMLDEVEALLLLERGLQVGGAADQPGLTLFPDPAFEDGFYKHRPVLLDEGLDVLFAGVRAEHFGARIPGKLQEFCAVEHAGDFHGVLSSSGVAGQRVCDNKRRGETESRRS